MADLLSRAPIMAIWNFFRMQLTQNDWIKALNKDEELVEVTGPWKQYNKAVFDVDGLKFIERQPRA